MRNRELSAPTGAFVENTAAIPRIKPNDDDEPFNVQGPSESNGGRFFTWKVSNAEMAMINIQPHEFHGEWNYTVHPKA
ncbi:MAG: hypothetical protein QF435_16385 [Arenicellales bacterium]|jgi:hypothetical protein|nr:hypothetical protein [Arenicellales bacterium]